MGAGRRADLWRGHQLSLWASWAAAWPAARAADNRAIKPDRRAKQKRAPPFRHGLGRPLCAIVPSGRHTHTHTLILRLISGSRAGSNPADGDAGIAWRWPDSISSLNLLASPKTLALERRVAGRLTYLLSVRSECGRKARKSVPMMSRQIGQSRRRRRRRFARVECWHVLFVLRARRAGASADTEPAAFAELPIQAERKVFGSRIEIDV